MKKTFTRIGIELVISDKETKQILKEAGSYFDGDYISDNDNCWSLKKGQEIVFREH